MVDEWRLLVRCGDGGTRCERMRAPPPGADVDSREEAAVGVAAQRRGASEQYMSFDVLLSHLRCAGVATSSSLGLGRAEPLVRRWQPIFAAHSRSAASPDYEGSDLFEALEKRRFGIATDLHGYVARKMKGAAEIKRPRMEGGPAPKALAEK